MGSGFNNLVYVDMPPMPNAKLLASSFPVVAPAQNRMAAIAMVDEGGCVSLSHNSTAVSPTFSFLTWSDIAGYWIQPYAALACAQYGQIQWKAMTNTAIYIYASTALIGAGAIVVLGGLTVSNNLPTPTAG